MKKIKKLTQLVATIQTGDTEAIQQNAIRELYGLCHPKMIGAFQKQFPKLPLGDIQDAFHDALMVLIEDFIKPQKEINDVMSLLFIIMRNIVIKYANWRKKHIAVDPDSYLEKFDQKEEITIFEKNNDQSELAMEAFNQLKPKCQEIIMGKLVYGLSSEEIAAEHNSTRKSIRVQKFRCLKQLIKNYKQLASKV